jgi:hypothetical protein
VAKLEPNVTDVDRCIGDSMKGQVEGTSLVIDIRLV